ncbi:MAG: 50S ribosomal protein L19 [Candidatus Omnitrophica bacterium ADurb.Bin205]|nr:MAG: 50S ribosomal protein L19 [Candidatus Omnitrophica bacterium ADurb.Bin205]
MNKIKLVEAQFAKKDLPVFGVGDTVKVFTRIPEGPDKFRLHPFEGVVISKEGSGIKEHFTIRKVSYGEGIERVFPLNSPTIEKIEVVRSGKVKRAKLYYLRNKFGKRATKIASADVK